MIGYRGAQILDRIGHIYDDTPIEYVRQPEPIGLADAVRRAGHAVSDDPFVVCNGDNVLRGDLTRSSPRSATIRHCSHDARGTNHPRRSTEDGRRGHGRP